MLGRGGGGSVRSLLQSSIKDFVNDCVRALGHPVTR